MKQYKGYYIDNVIFSSEREIDIFLEKREVQSYKDACELFAHQPTIPMATYCDEIAVRLVEQFGYTWEQVEELEAAAHKTA